MYGRKFHTAWAVMTVGISSFGWEAAGEDGKGQVSGDRSARIYGTIFNEIIFLTKDGMGFYDTAHFLFGGG